LTITNIDFSSSMINLDKEERWRNKNT